MPKVEYRNVSFKNLINNDAGSGAKNWLATFRPDLSDGWFYLGPAATNHDQVPGNGIIVKQLEPGVLVDVADWIQVWNDAGSGNKTDYALWRGVGPNPDYIVVGGFFTRSNSKPTAAETRGIKAIHRSALQNTSAGSEIWNDGGSKARANGAIWSTASFGVVPTGAFVPVQGYNNPPREVYGLQPNQVTKSGVQVKVKAELQRDFLPRYVGRGKDLLF